jgi:hypothetical protein
MAGWMLAFGSVLFLIAAFMPISRVYATREVDHQLDLVQGSQWSWRLSQFLFGAGALIAAAGAGWWMLAAPSTWPRVLLVVPAAALAAGALLWSWHTYQRAVDPAAFFSGELPRWPFSVYTISTLAAVAFAGAYFLDHQTTWLGLTLTIGATVFLLAFLVFHDLPPFVHYGLLLVMAIHLIQTR